MTGKGSILAVDDTEASLKVLSDFLREEGYSVRAALRGDMALRSALHQPPDLVLLDIRMPDIDGFEVCRQLKSHPATRDVPVIFISGLTETDEKLRGFEIGAVDYVTKPYQRAELLARVAAHVNLRLIQKQVAAQNEELRQYREHLEELVARRTAELRESNRNLELMSFALDQVREAAYLINEKGDFLYVNQEASRAHGYGAEELCGMNVTDINPDSSPEVFARAWQEVCAKGVATFETRHRHRDGSVFPVEISSSYLDYEGNPLHLALVRDISERKDAERRLRESYDLLEELTSRRESAREEERRHIAREIHDELGQRLTALRMGISTVRYRLGSQNPSLTGELQELAAQMDETIQVVRNIATALRPSVLDMGISPALKWLAGQFRVTTGIACDIDLPEKDIPLPEDAAIALFRIVQEALTNVARHAEAQAVTIALNHDGSGYRAEIRDNGLGYDAAAKQDKSFGLMGMRERAAMLGGTLVVDTLPGKGTRLQVFIPIARFQEKS